MQKYIPLVLVVFVVLSLHGETLDQAPRFQAESLDGEVVTLDSLLQNGPVFVSFWALWCKPCIRELDELKPVWEKYHERGFEIVAVSQDGPRSVSRVKPMVRSKKWEYTVLLDPDKELSRAFQVIALPTSFLIDADGNVVRAQQGYKSGMEEVIEKEVEDLLAGLERREESQEVQGEKEMDDLPVDPEGECEDGHEEAPPSSEEGTSAGADTEEEQNTAE